MSLINTLARLPLGLFLAAYLGYLGMQYYSFDSDPTSPLGVKKAQRQAALQLYEQTKEKIKQAEEFKSVLDSKRIQIQILAKQLSEMKAHLSETSDPAKFIKSIITEASKVGLKINSIKPAGKKDLEFYSEDSFDLSFHGAFVQLVVFTERLVNMESLLTIENFNIHRDGTATANYVELDGTIQLKTFHYLMSKADEIIKNNSQGFTSTNVNKASAAPTIAPVAPAPVVAAPPAVPAAPQVSPAPVAPAMKGGKS